MTDRPAPPAMPPSHSVHAAGVETGRGSPANVTTPEAGSGVPNMVTVSYKLSVSGQKANLLAGGSGKAVQTVQVKAGDPEYAAAVGLAEVSLDGSAKIELHASVPQGKDGTYRVREYDAQPAVGELLAHESERREFVRARVEKAAAAELAELLADVPSSLIFKSTYYGWKVKDEVGKHAEAIGEELIAEARTECERRSAADKAAAEGHKAAQEAQAAAEKQAKAERAAREKAEIKAWAEQHGSERLRRCVREGIECGAVYRDERLASEYPDWEVDGSHMPSWDEPRNPPAEALELLDKARASLPADWTEEERAGAELRYWTGTDEYGEKVSGYVVTVDPGNWTADTLVYGYDGPTE